MRASDEEVERLAKECWDTRLKFVRLRDGAMGAPWEDVDNRSRESYRCLARHLIENRGCKAPPDPVEEIFRKAVAEGVYRNEGPSMVYAAPPKALADYLLARFNVTPKGGDDA